MSVLVLLVIGLVVGSAAVAALHKTRKIDGLAGMQVLLLLLVLSGGVLLLMWGVWEGLTR